MALVTKRFVVDGNEIKAVARMKSEYTPRKTDEEPDPKPEVTYHLEILFYEAGSFYLDYNNEADRDHDFDLVAAVIR